MPGVVRILIVDDEPLARRGVRFCLRGEKDVNIVGECATGQEAVNQIQDARPDLVFLDVQMPGMDGFEVLKLVPRERWPLVIFLTAHNQHALRAFDVHAVDYVLKPIDDDRFAAALERARQRLQERSAHIVVERLGSLLDAERLDRDKGRFRERFAVRTGSRTLVVAVGDVTWIEAAGDYATLHSGQKSYLLRETLDALERDLDPKRFVRIHRSTIVALEQVRELHALSSRDYLVRLKEGAELRLSRTYRDRLKELL